MSHTLGKTKLKGTDVPVVAAGVLVNKETALTWSESLRTLLDCRYGNQVFAEYLNGVSKPLKNLHFWNACEELRSVRNANKLLEMAQQIYLDFIVTEAEYELDLPAEIRSDISRKIQSRVVPLDAFHQAQKIVYSYMKLQDYESFKKSTNYKVLVDRCEGNDTRNQPQPQQSKRY